MTTTISQPWADYKTDGTTKRYTFGFPYLNRSHIMVTRDGGAPALFRFVDDHTIEAYTLFGDPIPKGEPLKIFRQTPDLDAFASYKDGALLTAEELNRARLQVLYLIQERSGGLAGSVSTVVALLTNEIETLSGALSSLQYSQGQLTAGLQTIGELNTRMESMEDGQAALQDLINKTVADFDASKGVVANRLDAVETEQGNLRSAVSSQIATLTGNDIAFASRVDKVEAKMEALDLTGKDGKREDEVIAAAVITSTIAEAKSHYSQAKTLTTLKSQFGAVEAMIQTEATTRATADSALAQQITAIQVEIGENLAQVIQDMSSQITSVNGRVSKVESNYSLKVMAEREDGKKVFAGIGLNATASDDYTGSEIILAAERLMFAAQAAPDGPLKPMFTAGNVDGSPTFVIPSNVMGDRMYPGRLLVDGSIEARSIAAGAVTADKIKAGEITTDLLAVGLGANLLNASEFTERRAGSAVPMGWFVSQSTGVQPSWVQSSYDMVGWTLLGGHTFGLGQTGTSGDTNLNNAHLIFYSDLIPVTPGTRYEYSAYVGVHRCAADITLYWYDSANAGLAGVAPSTPYDDAYAPVGSPMGGPSLTGYRRIGGIAKAPQNAAGMRLVLRKAQHATGVADSWLFVTRPFVGETAASATRLSPYTPGGLRTLITPGGISTPSLSAISATLGFLMSGTAGGLRTEMDGPQIRVYDQNNRLRVRLGIW